MTFILDFWGSRKPLFKLLNFLFVVYDELKGMKKGKVIDTQVIYN
jgi:hypothetical protein